MKRARFGTLSEKLGTRLDNSNWPSSAGVRRGRAPGRTPVVAERGGRSAHPPAGPAAQSAARERGPRRPWRLPGPPCRSLRRSRGRDQGHRYVPGRSRSCATCARRWPAAPATGGPGAAPHTMRFPAGGRPGLLAPHRGGEVRRPSSAVSPGRDLRARRRRLATSTLSGWLGATRPPAAADRASAPGGDRRLGRPARRRHADPVLAPARARRAPAAVDLRAG